MSPIEIPTPSIPLNLPSIDVNLIGSYILTVWQLANQYQIVIILFFLVLAVSAIGWLYRFVTHRQSTEIDISELWRGD